MLSPGTRSDGGIYEDKAQEYLVEHGYEIVARNFRTRLGEIDIIARKNGILVFVEVKGGKPFPPPQTRVTPSKIKKLTKAIHYFLSRKISADSYHTIRLDVLVVLEPDYEIQHFEDITAH